MKTLILALLVATAAAAPRAIARPPISNTMKGEIVSVEPEHYRFTVRTMKTPEGVALSWGPRTHFIQGGTTATPTSLKRGQQITANYRAPLFGPKIASRVFIFSAK